MRSSQGTVRHHPLPRPSVKHRLDILPGVHHLVMWVSQQADVSTPGVEIRSIRLDVFPPLSETVGVEHKLQPNNNKLVQRLETRD